MGRPLFIRILKFLFLLLHPHVWMRPFAFFSERLKYLLDFSKWKTQHAGIPHSDYFNLFPSDQKRFELYNSIISNEVNDAPIQYMEFGVYKGDSLKWWLEHVKNLDSRFFGFDSFEGLPEDWGKIKKGTFNVDGQFPDITDPRCEFVKGWFQDTLEKFIQAHDFKRKVIIHLDADLYSASLFVLNTLSPVLKNGDIILFDEFTSLAHEFRAFTEFTEKNSITYTVIAASNNYTELAVKIL